MAQRPLPSQLITPPRTPHPEPGEEEEEEEFTDDSSSDEDDTEDNAVDYYEASQGEEPGEQPLPPPGGEAEAASSSAANQTPQVLHHCESVSNNNGPAEPTTDQPGQQHSSYYDNYPEEPNWELFQSATASPEPYPYEPPSQSDEDEQAITAAAAMVVVESGISGVSEPVDLENHSSSGAVDGQESIDIEDPQPEAIVDAPFESADESDLPLSLSSQDGESEEDEESEDEDEVVVEERFKRPCTEGAIERSIKLRAANALHDQSVLLMHAISMNETPTRARLRMYRHLTGQPQPPHEYAPESAKREYRGTANPGFSQPASSSAQPSGTQDHYYPESPSRFPPFLDPHSLDSDYLDSLASSTHLDEDVAMDDEFGPTYFQGALSD
ncbi:hypothetical protein BGX33_010857 [Mortierella sp. NVP41]|nr:hypothetical protein BGX33_010857 [Mortierella sp. NVP41]